MLRERNWSLLYRYQFDNAPASVQSVINDILEKHVDIIFVAFIDDILFHSQSLEHNEVLVKKSLQVLTKARVFWNVENYEFSVTKTQFLGFISSA